MTFDSFGAALSINPANGEQIGRYPYESVSEMEATLVRVQAGFEKWRDVEVEVRAGVLLNLASQLRTQAEGMAQLAANEMGKPVVQGRAKVEKCAALCEWYAQHGPRMLEPEPTLVEDDKAYVAYRPLGAVLAVMPWNFPFWQVMRGVVPIILSGNPYVLKHAPNVMGCAYKLQQAWRDAGLPDGVFEIINVVPSTVSKAIEDPRIATVTVTGSVRAGSAIGAQAGAALKKCVLELGGSDPFVVLADADIDEAVNAAVVGRFQNSGQVCIAAKRIIVEQSVAEAFESKFVDAVTALKLGDPLENSTYIGPMARADLRDELDEQVKATVAQGAKLLLGGKKIEGIGNYYEPTILTDVRPGMTSFVEELFGPVASLIVARDAIQALELANDSEFGLAGSIWTADVEMARRFAARMITGGVFINGYVATDPRVPIGGVKKSGFGRELSHYGLREFCNAQTVWLARR